MLNKEVFSLIIKNTPLVSIDLIVRNNAEQVLLGQRLNRPAKGYWFVPGGRIMKDETQAEAFRRLTLNELGVAKEIGDSCLIDAYYQWFDIDDLLSRQDVHPNTKAYFKR